MSIIGAEVNWYRNEADKTQDKPKGFGTLVHLELVDRAAEGIAVIIANDGRFIEQPLSRLRVKSTANTMLEEEIVELNVKIDTAEAEIKSLQSRLKTAQATITSLKKVKASEK